MGTSASGAGQDRPRGSRQWFDDHWRRSLEQGRFLYPRADPTSQWELFEREKAMRVDEILDEKRISAGLALECGCGTAGMSVYLANRGFMAIGTDVSPNALELARMNVSENGSADGISRLHLLAADVFVLPFSDGSFDLVMSHGLLEHFDRQSLRPVVREMMRVLKPGGLFLADISHGAFSVRKLARWLNFPLSFGYYLCHADFDGLIALRRAYFDGFYENRLNAADWERELEEAGLSDVQVSVMRPFPPLDLPSGVGGNYTVVMAKLSGFWHWFDQAQSWATRRWGWLYLAYGTKPS